ncbi:hypothetical protein [Streptomyces sp. A1547]|uniref:hypothetical protein n=1 Tax=Streptomyces sp. A1547 TaxID=2563105 RepID=UPI00109E545D|nr:hypothetical protein [Streptomyces sp. A1547]THA32831.1 hypothetical protein E6W17_32765 [Streptomyces sp. A1547]
MTAQHGRSLPSRRRAIGFHFLDYVVHTCDAARALDLPFAPDPDIPDAALPIALAVPNGADRTRPGAAFAPSHPEPTDSDTLTRILLHLGRSLSRGPSLRSRASPDMAPAHDGPRRRA